MYSIQEDSRVKLVLNQCVYTSSEVENPLVNDIIDLNPTLYLEPSQVTDGFQLTLVFTVRISNALRRYIIRVIKLHNVYVYRFLPYVNVEASLFFARVPDLFMQFLLG